MYKISALTINGLAPRGNPILGLSRFKENATQLPYTTLIYGNGPGNHQPRRDPTTGPNSTDSPYYVQYAAIHQEEAFHDGSDVAIFAAGPYAHLFQGVQEQSYIAHVFAYAMCIGDYSSHPHCRIQTTHLSNDPFSNNGNSNPNREDESRIWKFNNPGMDRNPGLIGNDRFGSDSTLSTTTPIIRGVSQFKSASPSSSSASSSTSIVIVRSILAKSLFNQSLLTITYIAFIVSITLMYRQQEQQLV